MRFFVHRLKALLQRLPQPTVPRWPIDFDEYRRGLLENLRQIDKAGHAYQRHQQEWSEEGRLESFLIHLAQALPESFMLSSRKQFGGLLAWAIHRRLGVRILGGLEKLPDWLTPPERTELDRLAERAWEATSVQPYARRIRLLRLDDQAEDKPLLLTQAGRIFLDLSGSEAIRWLLLQEVVREGEPGLLTPALARFVLQSANGRKMLRPFDIARTHDEVLNRLAMLDVLRGVDFYDWPDPEFPEPPSVDFRILAKLYYQDDDREPPYEFQFSLPPLGKTLLEAIASDEDSPMKLLASTLFRDQTAQVLADRTSGLGSVTVPATDELIRQARMIAHELNNVLPPVRPAIEDLFQTLGETDRAAPQLLKYRARIEASVDRALRFVNELRDTVQLARGNAREAIDVAACLREAIASLNGEAAAITLLPLPNLPPLRGQRPGLVKALAELLRNALRATQSRTPQIRVTAQLAGQYIQVTIDDNGPGVPPEQREAIFVDGFSSRGGGGQGLGLVREALRALGGSVSCEDGPLGGARFAVTLPLTPSAPVGEAAP